MLLLRLYRSFVVTLTVKTVFYNKASGAPGRLVSIGPQCDTQYDSQMFVF